MKTTALAFMLLICQLATAAAQPRAQATAQLAPVQSSNPLIAYLPNDALILFGTLQPAPAEARARIRPFLVQFFDAIGKKFNVAIVEEKRTVPEVASGAVSLESAVKEAKHFEQIIVRLRDLLRMIKKPKLPG